MFSVPVKKTIYLASSSREDTKEENSHRVEKTPVNQQRYEENNDKLDYYMERYSSALKVAKELQMDTNNIESPTTHQTIETAIKKLGEIAEKCLVSNESVVNNIQAKHNLKTIVSYGFVNRNQSKAHNSAPTLSLEGFPEIIEKCVKWFEIDKLPNNASILWWVNNISVVSLDWSENDSKFRESLVWNCPQFLSWIFDILAAKHLQDIQNTNGAIRLILEYYLSTIYNLARHSSFRSHLVELNAIKIAESYLSSDNKVSKTVALMVIAYLASDEETNHLNDNFGIIPNLVEFLAKALQDSDHDHAGFSAEELAAGCFRLMANDDCKVKFVEAGILPLLDQLLHSNIEVEQERAIDCLWALSFNEEERLKILENQSFIDKLREISESSSGLKAKASKAVEFITKGKSDIIAVKEDLSDNSNKDQIYVCFSPSKQVTSQRIQKFLVANGFRVSNEIDSSSSLQAVAQAIEQAKAVILCYCDDFKQDPSCRIQAEYSYQRRKPIVPVNLQFKFTPENWLGLVVGSRQPVDMSLIKATFDESSKILLTELRKLTDSQPPVKGDAVKPVKNEVKHEKIEHSNFSKFQKISFVKTKLKNWSKDQVEKWILNQMTKPSDGIMEFAKNLDGSQLAAVFEMKLLAPDFFYAKISDQLSNSIVDVLKFSEVLENTAFIQN